MCVVSGATIWCVYPVDAGYTTTYILYIAYESLTTTSRMGKGLAYTELAVLPNATMDL